MQTVDIIETNGMWIGIMEDISKMLVDDSLSLNSGDIMSLHTDGITEAWIKGSKRNSQKHLFGLNRLQEIFRKLGDHSLDDMKNGILAILNEKYDIHDDATLVLIKKL